MKSVALVALMATFLLGVAAAEEPGTDKAPHQVVAQEIKSAREAILADADDAGAHRALVRAYFLWKRMKEITREYQNKLEEDADNAVLTYALGLCHSYAGERARGEKLYQKALALNPELAYARYSLGVTAHRRNELTRARDWYRKALASNPEIAEAHHNLGIILLSEKAYGKALKHLAQAATLSPADPQTARVLGSAYLRMGLADKAVDAFMCYRELAPEDIKAGSLLAEAYRLKGRREPAYIRKSAYQHNEVGATLLRRRDYQAAEQEFLRAIEVDPDFAPPYNNLAWLYATAADERFQRSDKAVQLASLGVKLTKAEDWHYLDTLAEAYFVSGNLEAAVEAARKALNLASRNRSLRRRLAQFEEAWEAA